MTIRILNFADGFTSATAPSGEEIRSYAYLEYENDAAFEADKGTPSNGMYYYNTTDNKVRIYENGSWVENASFEA